MDDVVNERSAVIEAVKTWGYFDRGIGVQRWLLNGRRILDFSMDGGPWSVAAVEAAGAGFYAGVGPMIGTKRVRDFRSLKDASHPAYNEFPYTPNDLQRLFPNIRLFQGTLEQNADKLRGLKLDTAVLTDVISRLHDPVNAIRIVSELLDRDGLLYVNHSNYYSWNGHGLNPRSVQGIDKADAGQAGNIDWKHLDPSHPGYSSEGNNRIRLHDLKDLINKHFEIIDWSPTVDAADRLTPQIRAKLKKFSLADLTHTRVNITAKKRSIATWKSLGDRQFYHPDDNYLAKQDHSRENGAKYNLVHHVLFSADGRLFSHSDNDYAGRRVILEMKPGQKVRLIKGGTRLNLTVKEVNPQDGSEPTAKFVDALDDRYLSFDRTDWRVELAGLNLEP